MAYYSARSGLLAFLGDLSKIAIDPSFSFADEIGADCYARAAMECVRKVRNSIGGGK